MIFAASILLAGAIAFCADEPSEPRCADADITAAALTEDQGAAIDDLAGRIRLSTRYGRERAGADEWRVVAPGRNADCEDRLLWAAGELRRAGLGSAYRFVAIERSVDYTGTQRTRTMHLVLVIETTGGPLVLDTEFDRPQRWQRYAGQRAFTPVAGMGGQWTFYAVN